MLRRTLPPGSLVFHERAGVGVFRGWADEQNAVVDFGDEVAAIPRKDLVEIEPPKFGGGDSHGELPHAYAWSFMLDVSDVYGHRPIGNGHGMFRAGSQAALFSSI